MPTSAVNSIPVISAFLGDQREHAAEIGIQAGRRWIAVRASGSCAPTEHDLRSRRLRVPGMYVQSHCAVSAPCVIVWGRARLVSIGVAACVMYVPVESSGEHGRLDLQAAAHADWLRRSSNGTRSAHRPGTGRSASAC